MIDIELARIRAAECRRVVRRLASIPFAREEWERRAKKWEEAKTAAGKVTIMGRVDLNKATF